MKPVVRLLLKAAVCRANVLLFGESGVGKAFLAKRIHDNSPGASGAFHTVFCMPDDRAAAELVERLEALESQCGTVYVRGIDLLSPMGQRRLLAYLDGRERRMKSGYPSDGSFVRLIFSSQKDLRLEALRGRYLSQLCLRTSVITIQVPPLRQRGKDVVSLAKHFVDLYSHRESKRIRGLSDDAEYLLRNLSWEGNIHELKNAINRAVVLAEEGQVVDVGLLEGVLTEVGV
jgi:DNA-binding NtrC family response regulator